MKNVVWSIVGSGGFRIGNEEDFICTLADKYPNITGAFADDFLGAAASTVKTDEEKRRIILGIRQKFEDSGHKLDLWLTVYTRDIETCSAELYGLFDCLTLWTWEYEKLRDLRKNFETMERRFPRQKKYIGIYILNYPTGKAIPDEYMEMQCEFGLEMLRQKRADGLIFLTNCVMGIGLSSEYWLRNWIDRVKGERLD
jgi:hypothetical protein